MIVIWPIPVTPDDISIAAPGAATYDLWDEATVYAAGDRVVSGDGRIWERSFTTVTLQDTTVWDGTGVDPAAQEGFYVPYGAVIAPEHCLKPNPTQLSFWWINVSTNGILDPDQTEEYYFLYAPLYNQTTFTAPLVLTPRYPFNALALFNLDADSVTVSVGDYSRTKSTAFSEGSSRRRELGFFDLPDYAYGSPLTITLTGAAKLGYLCLGIRNDVALSGHGVTVGIRDFSHKEWDVLGSPTIIRREYANTVSFQARAETSDILEIRRFLAQLRATPAAYIAHPELDDTLVFGFYQDFSIPIQAYTDSEISLDVLGLV